MKTSDATDKILPAFAALLADVEDPVKNARNPHFNSRYATLGALLECVRPHLEAHGLALCQDVGSEVHDGHVLPFIRTQVIHAESGQWVGSERLYLRPTKPDPQQAGSAITYGRRYSLEGFFALTATDDDGNRGSGRKPRPPKAEPKAAAPKPPTRQEAEAADVHDDLARRIAEAPDLDTLRDIWDMGLSRTQKNALEPLLRKRQGELGA